VADLVDTDIQCRRGLPVTTAARTCWDLAQWLDPVEAVVLVDALVAARLVSLAEQESRLRVRLVLAGLPTPVTQHVITQAGRFVARVDLAWPEHRVAVEYDGTWHATTEQFHADRRRLNGLAATGWIVLHVTATRLREDFDRFVGELRAALARGR
jgi:very-short-patch-repair endonuclease